MTGFYIHVGSLGQRIAYHCDSCSLTVVFAADQKPRTWCCGKYVEYQNPANTRSLPKVMAKVPIMVLRQRPPLEDQNGEV
jgi:hypothetical protein